VYSTVDSGLTITYYYYYFLNPEYKISEGKILKTKQVRPQRLTTTYYYYTLFFCFCFKLLLLVLTPVLLTPGVTVLTYVACTLIGICYCPLLLLFFWPSVDMFPREFKNWDIQNYYHYIIFFVFKIIIISFWPRYSIPKKRKKIPYATQKVKKKSSRNEPVTVTINCLTVCYTGWVKKVSCWF